MGNFLGKQLRNYRQRNELTQKQLANILYVSDRTVSKWERGAGYPDIDTLKRLGIRLTSEDKFQFNRIYQK